MWGDFGFNPGIFWSGNHHRLRFCTTKPPNSNHKEKLKISTLPEIVTGTTACVVTLFLCLTAD